MTEKSTTGQCIVSLEGVLPGSVLHGVFAGKSIGEICATGKCITGRYTSGQCIILLGGALLGSVLQEVSARKGIIENVPQGIVLLGGVPPDIVL